jgi:hypothetical protein
VVPIRVRLYPERLFHASTGAPPWADGAYARGDGIQVASGGVARLEEEMERVLAHELAHAFITHRSAGRAPRWLQEGLAQALSPRGGHQAASPRSAMAHPEALDHAGAHAFTDALIQEHGLTALLDVLAALGRQQPLDCALRGGLGGSQEELYRAWWESLLPLPATAEARP